jgi:hypothetical protein
MALKDDGLSPQALTALRNIRAIRRLPETSSTVAAEKRVLNQLNSKDTLSVALALEGDDRQKWEAWQQVPR